MKENFEELLNKRKIEYVKDVKLKEYTTAGVGGKCDFMVFPRKEDLSFLWNVIKEKDFFVLGGGSNLLVSDSGFKGVVINTLKMNELKVIEEGEKEAVIYAGAGVRINKILSICLKKGFSGFEFLAGVPASAGGAVKMNAGAFGSSVSRIVKSVEIFKEGRVEKITPSEKDWDYREFKREGIIVGVEFLLKKTKKEEVLEKVKSFLAERITKQPIGKKSFGCAFKNPQGEFAGKLIELAGLKGFRIGGAEVSTKHANFIINTSSATAEDMLSLIKLVRKVVFEKFGILLEPEVKLVGCEI